MDKENEKYLFICNTVFQTMIALWISHHYYPNKKIEFWISDHMNNGDSIAAKVNDINPNYKATYIRTRKFIFDDEKGINKQRYFRLFPQKLLSLVVEVRDSYKKIFIANMDRFAQLTYNALSHLQKTSPKLFLYEDGISTYSLLMNNFYDDTKLCDDKTLRQKIAKLVCRDKSIWGNIKYALVFEPRLMSWTPSQNRKIKKIDKNDKRFLDIVNYVFDYSGIENEYDKKYIFLEESYSASGIEVNDIEIVNKLSEKVGKENILVKIHPRNPVNRFEKLGYKTSKNNSIPWEVICMNLQDISEKVLISISSSALVMPSLVLGCRYRAYSYLGSIVNNTEVAKKIKPELLEMVIKFYNLYGIKILEFEK